MNAGVFRRRDAVREVCLTDRDGRRLSALLRRYQAGEEEKLIDCIRDEDKDTYIKRSLYLTERLQQEAENGKILFLVAEVLAGEEAAPGELAGMLILKQLVPEEKVCEMCCLVIRKKYRGYGLAMPFLGYGLDIARDGRYSAVYGLPALFQGTAQKLLYRLGMCATGFMFNILDREYTGHFDRENRNQKHPGVIQMMALEKKSAGTLYLPPEHRAFCRLVYDRLGVKYRIYSGLEHCDRQKYKGKRRAVSEIACTEDQIQSSLEICIRRVGADLEEQLAKIGEDFPLTGRYTANALVNINDKAAVYAYDQLQKMGYFFAGLKPLCGEREYIVLHNPGKTATHTEDYIVPEECAMLLLYVNEYRKKDSETCEREAEN